MILAANFLTISSLKQAEVKCTGTAERISVEKYLLLHSSAAETSKCEKIVDQP